MLDASDESVVDNDIPYLKKQNLFTLRKLPTESYDGTDTYLSVTFEMRAERQVLHKMDLMGFCDLLAMVGGIAVLTYVVFSMFMAIMNFNRIDNWLVS